MNEIIKSAANLNYEDIKIGDVYEFERQISRDDNFEFAKLVGNFNPLHADDAYGRQSRFGGIIVYGMLAGSLFSTLLGMYCPGEKSLCLSQTLNFRQAIYPGDKVKVRGTVANKNDSTKIITVKTQILKEGNLVLDGEAKVLYLV